MSQRDPKPVVYRLEELARLVKSGDIKLPRFQRPFVWKRPDMLKLLDSIYKGYPIGSLLIWDSSQRLKSERDIAGLKVNEDATIYPTSYLLDGQQRLTTLCGALYWDGSGVNSIWGIHFDLESEEFIYPKDINSVTIFPLNKLLNTSDFIRQCMKLEHLTTATLLTERAERLLRAIKDYQLAVVKIGDMSIEEVAPIFERINSTGRKLTIVDLMMAATWSNGFDLAEEITNIQQSCLKQNFVNATDALILRSVAASANLGVNKDDIQKLRKLTPEQLSEATARCKSSIDKAVSWLKESLQVHDANYLPYGLYFTFAVEFFRNCTNPSPQQLDELKAWFWFTSTTQQFGGASTGDIARELANVRDFSNQTKNYLFVRKEINITRFLLDKFTLKNASSTAFALMLFSLKPPRTITGKNIELQDFYEKTSRAFTKYSPKRSQAYNISLIVHPFKNDIITTDSKWDLGLHLLDDSCLASIAADDHESFYFNRASLIRNWVSAMTGCTTIINIDDDFDRSDRVEEEDEVDLL
jgi:hypothetical protein